MDGNFFFIFKICLCCLKIIASPFNHSIITVLSIIRCHELTCNSCLYLNDLPFRFLSRSSWFRGGISLRKEKQRALDHSVKDVSTSSVSKGWSLLSGTLKLILRWLSVIYSAGHHLFTSNYNWSETKHKVIFNLIRQAAILYFSTHKWLKSALGKSSMAASLLIHKWLILQSNTGSVCLLNSISKRLWCHCQESSDVKLPLLKQKVKSHTSVLLMGVVSESTNKFGIQWDEDIL